MGFPGIPGFSNLKNIFNFGGNSISNKGGEKSGGACNTSVNEKVFKFNSGNKGHFHIKGFGNKTVYNFHFHGDNEFSSFPVNNSQFPTKSSNVNYMELMQEVASKAFLTALQQSMVNSTMHAQQPTENPYHIEEDITDKVIPSAPLIEEILDTRDNSNMEGKTNTAEHSNCNDQLLNIASMLLPLLSSIAAQQESLGGSVPYMNGNLVQCPIEVLA